LALSAVFLISGIKMRNASDVRGRDYGLLAARLDYVLMVLYPILSILIAAGGYIPGNNLPLFYMILVTPEALCNCILMLILPTLSSVEFVKNK